MPGKPPALLCNVNFPANTGFAWDYIEGIYARLADHLAGHGIRTLVAYPSIPSPPRALQGSAAEPVELDTSLRSPRAVLSLAATVRRENVMVLYLSDRETIGWAYAPLRRAGVRRAIVHDHASGLHAAPRGVRRALKWAATRTPLFSCDTVVAVSDFVAERQLRVGLFPPERVVRIYNAVTARRPARPTLRKSLGVSKDRPIVACACRATPEKGVEHLLRAFDHAARERTVLRPQLVYVGDGPAFTNLERLRSTLAARDDIHLLGYRPEAAALLAEADLCVVPSVWQEAFALSVLEPMAQGKPVIASRVGGVPEAIEHGVDGLMVPPADEMALARAIGSLLDDPARARRLGRRARQKVASQFTLERKLGSLLPLIEAGFGLGCGPAREPRAA